MGWLKKPQAYGAHDKWGLSRSPALRDAEHAQKVWPRPAWGYAVCPAGCACRFIIGTYTATAITTPTNQA